MNPLLVLGVLGVGAYFLFKGSSPAAGAAPTAAQLAASGMTPGSLSYGSPGNPIAPPDPAAYGYNADGSLIANGTTPGTPAVQTASGPLFHTGASCARTGAPFVTDSPSGYGGNPYLLNG